jgi:hypothetical protein
VCALSGRSVACEDPQIVVFVRGLPVLLDLTLLTIILTSKQHHIHNTSNPPRTEIVICMQWFAGVWIKAIVRASPALIGLGSQATRSCGDSGSISSAKAAVGSKRFRAQQTFVGALAGWHREADGDLPDWGRLYIR